MADDAAAATSKLKLKSKWNRLLSKDKSDRGNFTLNEDVVDFLKPSTDKYSDEGSRQWSTAPRIDVSLRQRWPNAADLKKAVQEGHLDAPSLGVSKPKRRKNLNVTFARTPPEVIGEGGDEAESPVIEVSRIKTGRMRSVSDNQPPPASNSSPLAPSVQGNARPDLYRSKTAPGQSSYIPQEKPKLPQLQMEPQQQQQQPLPQQSQPKPRNESPTESSFDPRPGMLKRAATGFSAYEDDVQDGQGDREEPEEQEQDVESSDNIHPSQRDSYIIPQIGPLSPITPVDISHTNNPFADQSPPQSPEFDSIRSPDSHLRHARVPSSPTVVPPPPQSRLFVAKAQNRLEAEGRTFRRVSRQVFTDEDINQLRSMSTSSSDTHTSLPKAVPDPPYPSAQSPQYEREQQQQQHQQQNNQYENQPALRAAQDYQSIILDSPVSEKRSSVSISVSPDPWSQDSALPGSNDSHGPPLLPPLSSPRLDIPSIETSYIAPADDTEATLSPDTLNRQRSIADTLYPTSSFSPTSSNLSLPGTNHSRSAFQSQSQGITPSPSNGPTASYFSPHPSESASRTSRSKSTSGAANTATPSSSPPPEPHHPSSSLPSQPSQFKAFSPTEGSPDAIEAAAYADFDSRVAHMKGVFRLTAEREQPASTVSPRQWLRAAIWWLHKGRAGLSQVARNTPRGPDGQKRELLTQAHVDVAKTWWILTDMLNHADSPQSETYNVARQVQTVSSHLRSLTLSMQRNGVMPPHQSLIQGQDTTIWISYPRFAPDAASLLHGPTSLVIEDGIHETEPIDALPAGDSKSAFFYNRMFADVLVNTDDAESHRAVLPCILTMMRSRTDFQPTIIISSQSDLINVRVKPGDGGHGKGPTWHDVSWKARSHGLYIRLPRGFNVSVELQDNDFRGLWNLVEYTRKMETSLKPQTNERLVHEALLTELQYSDSSAPHAFPKERVRKCNAFVFEKVMIHQEGTGARKMHRGFRLLLVTNPVNKTLSSVTHEMCKGSPLLYESIGNAAANEQPALVLRVQEAKRSCKALLLFSRDSERQQLYNVLSSATLDSSEAVIGQSSLKSLSIEPAVASNPGSILPGGGTLERLRWESVRIINKPNTGGQDAGNTVLSENLRIIAKHENGDFTDRLNLGPGELLLRLPITKPTTLQLLRRPQQDMTMSVDTRKCQSQVAQDVSELLHTMNNKPTIRSLTFPTMGELHAFQLAITGYTVRFNSPASLFAISRRRMVVPVYKKLETSNVRVQVLTHGGVTQIAAFFEDFAHADAMVFQVKASDVFEKAKGDKGARYCVKLVDAKFTLPRREKEKEKEKDRDKESEGGDEHLDESGWPKGALRRFVNLEGLEYAEEHDDITIGFEVEEDRDRFCEQLPAAATIKKFDLRRKT